MRSVIRGVFVVVAAVVILSGCPGLFGPSEADVEELLQLVMGAPGEVADSLVMEDTADGYDFANPDGSFVIDQDGVITLTDFSPATSDMVISGTTTAVSNTPTATGFKVEAVGDFTIVGADVEALTVTMTIDATMDPDTFLITAATITGTATADGDEFDVAEMDLAQIWIDATNALMAVMH